MKLLSFGIFICTATTYRLREYPVVSSRAKQKPKNPDALADCTTYLFGIISLVVYFFAVRGQSIPRKLVRVGWSIVFLFSIFKSYAHLGERCLF